MKLETEQLSSKNNDFRDLIKNRLILIVHEFQLDDVNPKTIQELANLTPSELQKIPITLNPQELMEQINYTLKAKVIKYSINLQKERKNIIAAVDRRIQKLEMDFIAGIQTEVEREQLQEELQEM